LWSIFSVSSPLNARAPPEQTSATMTAHRLLINLFVVAVHISGVGAWRCGGYKGRPGLRLTPLVISSIHMAESDTEPEVIPAPLPPLPLDAPLESGSGAMFITRGADGELQLVKPDGLDVSGLLTESQRRRLAPIKSLKRTRRSRKLRTPSERGDTKYVPLVAGARASTDEAILAAFNGDTLDAKREQGEGSVARIDPRIWLPCCCGRLRDAAWDAYADMLVPLSQITMSTPSCSRTRSIARTQPVSADPSTSSRRMRTPPTSSSKSSSPPTRTMSLDSSSLGSALSLSCSLRSRRCSRRTLRRRLRRSRTRFERMLHLHTESVTD
jgi:hypothetical protein